MFSSLWRAVTQHGPLVGYSYFALLWYFIGAETSVISTFSKVMDETAEAIITGAIESEMTRPASLVGLRCASEVGASLVRMFVIGGSGCLFGTVLAGGAPQPRAFALGITAAILGMIANVLGMHAFVGVTFWLRDARSSWFLYQKLLFLLGGMLLPLQVLPHALAPVMWALPFWAMAYAPGRLMSGSFEPWLLVGQLAWIAVLLGGAVGVFALGERRVTRRGA